MKPLPTEISQWLEQTIGSVRSFRWASGGSINQSGIITINKKTFFVKWNSSSRYPNMFTKEAKGLAHLSNAPIKVPHVVEVFEGKEYACLVLETIETGPPSQQFWQTFGEQLAAMHKITQSTFGLDHNNYVGSIMQLNTPSADWVDFYINSRLLPQIKMAVNNGKMSNIQAMEVEKIYTQLPNILNIEPPSLTHGDLWSGNFMINQFGQPVIIDPAVCFANRETDLAMTLLFGGFDQKFYEAYQAAWPTSPNLDERIAIYQLYPLLIHVNLFGGGYLSQVLQRIRQFI